MLDDDINPYFTNYKINFINNKKQITELISPINYSWKQLFKMMNKIKILWRMDKFDINFTLNSQELHKIIYTNLKYCDRIPNLKLKNKVLESKINSFFNLIYSKFYPKKKNYIIYMMIFSLKRNIFPKKMNIIKLFSNILLLISKIIFIKLKKTKRV